jgi:hypothetical protein
MTLKTMKNPAVWTNSGKRTTIAKYPQPVARDDAATKNDHSHGTESHLATRVSAPSWNQLREVAKVALTKMTSAPAAAAKLQSRRRAVIFSAWPVDTVGVSSTRLFILFLSEIYSQQVPG